MGVHELKKIIILMMALWASQATAQLLHGVTDSLSGGGTPVGPTCNGTIDLSSGCVQPMFGGL